MYMNELDFVASMESFIADALEENIVKYQKAGEKAMKQIRETIVNEWFGVYNPNSMHDATVYGSNVVKKTKDSASIEIYSYVNPSYYNHRQSAQNWYAKHQGEIDMSMTPEEYVLDLQLNQGIIGLPKEGQFSDWVNDYFIQQTPLRSYIDNHSMWRLWKVYVYKHL